MICDNCLHKEICIHRINILNGTYGYMKNNFDLDRCNNYVLGIHGQWLQRIDGCFECSKCSYSFEAEYEGYTLYFNYCPNCGVKMGR